MGTRIEPEPALDSPPSAFFFAPAALPGERNGRGGDLGRRRAVGSLVLGRRLWMVHGLAGVLVGEPVWARIQARIQARDDDLRQMLDKLEYFAQLLDRTNAHQFDRPTEVAPGRIEFAQGRQVARVEFATAHGAQLGQIAQQNDRVGTACKHLRVGTELDSVNGNVVRSGLGRREAFAAMGGSGLPVFAFR